MANEKGFSGNTGILWAQPGGPNTEPYLLECVDFPGPTESPGAIARALCPNPTVGGGWKVWHRTQAPPGEATGTITALVGAPASWLEDMARRRCPTAIYMHNAYCGSRLTFLNYDRGELMQDVLFTSLARTNMVQREADEIATQTFGISAADVIKYYPLEISRLVTTEAEALNDICFCNVSRCAGVCGDQQDVCTVGFIGADGGAASANVQFTVNEGMTWTAGAADPFAIGEHILGAGCFYVGKDTTRRIVGRGSTDAGNPAEIAYSDDAGATWTLVNVGATNGEFFQHTRSIFALDQRHIWGCTDQGNIYFSSDGGATWAAQSVPTATALNAIKFRDEHYGLCVGETNTILYTTDGGAHWTALTGPAAQAAVDALSCEIINAQRLWVGYGDGELYYSDDAGDNWAERSFTNPAGAVTVNVINDIHFVDAYGGSFVIGWTDGAGDEWGAIYRTVNGGFDWEVFVPEDSCDVAAATGFNSVYMCDYNHIYAAGEVISATAGIYLLAPAG